MSKVEAMRREQPTPRARVYAPPPAAPLLRWVRQGSRAGLWKPWWLLGLVEVVTYPRPRYRAARMLYVPGCRAIEGFEARPAFWVPA